MPPRSASQIAQVHLAGPQLACARRPGVRLDGTNRAYPDEAGNTVRWSCRASEFAPNCDGQGE